MRGPSGRGLRRDTRGRGEGPYPWCQRVAEGEATQTEEQPSGAEPRTRGTELADTRTGTTVKDRVAPRAMWAETAQTISSMRDLPPCNAW
jgi:hypothetical protein